MTKQYLLNTFYQSPVTYILMPIVLLVSIAGIINKKIFYRLILHPVSVVRGREYYRVITADLTNAGPETLLLNELILYVFCPHLEYTLKLRSTNGSIQFLTIYLGSLIFASCIIILKYYKQFKYSTTGTSGSIMGCMFGFMLLDPRYI